MDRQEMERLREERGAHIAARDQAVTNVAVLREHAGPEEGWAATTKATYRSAEAKYEAAEGRINEINALLGENVTESDTVRTNHTPGEKRTTISVGGPDAGRARSGATGQFVGQQNRGGVELLTREERFSTRTPNTEGLDLGRLLSCYVNPDQRTQHPAEARALAEGSGSAGGLLVPLALANTVVDLARNEARVVQAGALSVGMDSQTLSIPRLATGVTPQWRAEGAAIAEDTATFNAITLTAHSFAVRTKASREVLADMTPAGSAQIMSDIAKAIAAGWDYAALRGTGTSNQPTGLRFNANVAKTAAYGANGGIPTNYQALVKAKGRVKAANFSPNAFLMSARTEAGFGNLTSSVDSQPLNIPKYLDDMDWYSTNQIGDGYVTGTGSATGSEIYTGQWDNLVLGIREGITIQILNELYAETGQVGIVAHFRGDVAVLREQAFDIITGVLPAS
jgi:HK97 family phage major capsid protein